mgnify:CR=1 FL=1|jgi:hypothetical protein
MKFSHLNNSEIVKRISDNFDAKRLNCNMTYSEIATKSDISQKTVQKFVGMKNDIRLSTLIALLKSINQLDLLNPLIEQQEAYSPKAEFNQSTKKRASTTRTNKLLDDTNTMHEKKETSLTSFASSKASLFTTKTEDGTNTENKS